MPVSWDNKNPVRIARIFYKYLAISFEPNNEWLHCLFRVRFRRLFCNGRFTLRAPLLERFVVLSLIWKNDLHTGKVSCASLLAFVGESECGFRGVRYLSCRYCKACACLFRSSIYISARKIQTFAGNGRLKLWQEIEYNENTVLHFNKPSSWISANKETKMVQGCWGL